MKRVLMLAVFLLGACSAIVDGKEEDEDAGIYTNDTTSSDDWNSTGYNDTSDTTDSETGTGEPSTETDSESGDNTDSESSTDTGTETSEIDTEVDTEEECNIKGAWCDTSGAIYSCNQYTNRWNISHCEKEEQTCEPTYDEIGYWNPFCYTEDPEKELEGQEVPQGSRFICESEFICYEKKHVYRCEQIGESETIAKYIMTCGGQCLPHGDVPEPSYLCTE